MIARRGHPRARRAYAMVLVVVVSAMVSAVVAIIVSRQSAATLAHVRALDRYQDHHLRKGLQEVLSAWLRGMPARVLAEVVDERGRALEIDGGDRAFTVYLSDGQGTALDGPAGALGPEEQDALDRLLGELDGLWSQEPLTRSTGPLAISLQSAPPVLITAAIKAISPRTPPEPFVNAILEARGRALTQADVEQAANLAGIPPESRPLLQRFFTVQPQLWRVEVEERVAQGPERGLLLARHRGLIDLSPRTAAGRDRLSAGLEGGNLISDWTREPLELLPEQSGGGVRLQDGRERPR